MPGKSPLDDPQQAAFAWRRFRRLMALMMIATLVTVALAFVLIARDGNPVSIHFYIAIGLGLTFMMLLTGGLMGLVFLSSGTGHDSAVQQDEDRDPGDQAG